MSEQHELAIVFDGPPGPVSGRFLEVELDGAGIGIGKWLEGAAGIWKLVLPESYGYLAALEASEKAAVTRMNDAEDAMARMTDKLATIDLAAKFRGHKGNPESPCGGVGKCAICKALAIQDDS